MRQRTAAQLGLLDGLAAKVPRNDFVERLETLVHFYGLSDPAIPTLEPV